MSVGIYDADIAKYVVMPFNLEVMKLSAFYKRKGEIVVLSPEFTPEKNTRFIYRQDFDSGNYPINLTDASNVDYGGLAFTNNKYSPLPMEIEKMKPDTSIYGRIKPAFAKQKATTIFNQLTKAEHCRLSLDGHTIWPDYGRQFKYLPQARFILFHDYDLAQIENSYEEVLNILSRARRDGTPTRVGMKYPVCVSNGKDLLNWTSLLPSANFYSIEYDGVIDMPDFVQFVGTCRGRAVYKQLDYYVTMSSSSENDFVKNHLREIFRQVIISRSYRVFFTLKYEDNFFFDKRWEKVIDLLNYYHNSYRTVSVHQYLEKIGDDTLFNFAEKTMRDPASFYKGEVMTRHEIKEVFNFVRVAMPELFKDFYECSLNSLGGIYDPD